MGKAIMFAAVSLDGFIAKDDDTVGPLFDWYGNGDVAVTFGDENRVFHTTPATAGFLRSTTPNMAALVLGRRLFDITNGWDGVPPNGGHAFVVTHRPPTDWAYADSAPFTFVTDGVRSAIEQAHAYAREDRDITVTAGQIGGQAIREGLVDRVVLNLVPAVLGSGRPFFGQGGIAEPVLLEDPEIVQGRQVTHLVYDVRR
jgi:dihydrofolate reductase